MLVKIWSNQNIHMLLMGNWCLPKRNENTFRHIELYKNVHSRSTHNRSKLEVAGPNGLSLKGLKKAWYINGVILSESSQVAQWVKNLLAKQETRVWSLGWEDPLEEGMADHSSILAWEIPGTEEPGRLQYKGSQRVRHDWSNWPHMHKILSNKKE